MDGQRQKSQLELAFLNEPEGKAPRRVPQGTEPSAAKRETESPAREERLMEEVCKRNNLVKAWQQVQGNKGSPGVNGQTMDETLDDLREHWPAMRGQLLRGTYRPQPVRGVEIPQPGGGVRKLGLPTVLDRLIQQAVLQVLQKRWDPTFSQHSFGFRWTTGAESQRLISPRALQRFQPRVRELTSRTRGISIEQMIDSLKPYLLGWRGYFGFSQDPLVLRNLDARIRRRLRMVIWRQWGKVVDSIRQLTAIGVASHTSGRRCWLPDWLVGDVAPCGRSASAAQRLFRLARPPPSIGIFERLTPPNRRGTDPYARWCGRGEP